MLNYLPSGLPTRQTLSINQRQLLAAMQTINYGRIENLHIRDGLIVFNPAPRIIREIKFGSENGPRPEISVDDFVLKAPVRDMFAHIENLKDAIILKIEIKGGLPFSMSVEDHAA